MITTKPASLINSVTNIIEEVVEKCDEDTKMTLSYSKQDNYLMISVAVNQSFIVDENGFNFNLAKKFANQISADIFCENNFSDTLVIIKIPLN